MTAALELTGLVKRFGETHAVTSVSLAVEAGCVFGLIGPDGAGKTTTMRMAAGVSDPDAGTVYVDGAPFVGAGASTSARATRKLRASIGYMPQSYSLYADLSVEENLRFFGGMYGVDRATLRTREKRLLGMAHLDEFRDRPAGALSGGMYKKLALACALVHEPRLLLLDEPTNGVDPISRRELWAFLKELIGEGVAVLYSTPYMDEAARCDRVGLIVDGRITAIDTPAQLIAGFTSTVLEVSAQSPLEAAREALESGGGVDEVYHVGRRLHVVTGRGPSFASEVRAIAERALTERAGAARAGAQHAGAERAVAEDARAERAGAVLVDVVQVAPSFEDVFLALSRRAETSAGHANVAGDAA